MIRQRIVFLILLIFSATFASSAQTRKAKRFLKKAEQAEQQRKLPEAKSYYLKAIEADPDWAKPYQKLGVLAYQIQDDTSSIHYLEQAISKTDNFDPRVHHMLGELYMNNSQYKEAHHHWKAFLESNTDFGKLKEEARRQQRVAAEILDMMKDPVASNLCALPSSINTEAHEYLPIMPADERFMIFTRRYKRPGHRLTQEDYFISYHQNGKWNAATPVSVINTREPEGGATLSADGNTMVLVRCSEREGFGSCDLYISFKKGNGWSKAVNLGSKVNTEYKERQPSFSADGNRLYFASDRPGGQGGMDIWYMDWLSEGEWSKAVNMDSCINSKFNERAPFIHYDNQSLYFTSDRPESMGQSDIFLSRKQGDQWQKAKRLGWPVNTPGEEGTIYISIDGKTGYMGRINKENNSYDIYSFTLKEEIAANPSTYIHGKVVDAETGEPVCAKIEIFEKVTGQMITNLKSDQNGDFLLAIPKDKEYQFFAEADGYTYYSRQFNYEDFKKTEKGLFVTIQLHPVKTKKAEPITMENIFFETGSARLKPSSKAELEHLYQLLQKNPDLKIELHGHTDDIGSAQYNQNLSMNRAKAVYDHLIEKGINEQRLKYKGYGESKPVVPNTNPENRQRNRRTEFVIIEQ